MERYSTQEDRDNFMRDLRNTPIHGAIPYWPFTDPPPPEALMVAIRHLKKRQDEFERWIQITAGIFIGTAVVALIIALLK